MNEVMLPLSVSALFHLILFLLLFSFMYTGVLPVCVSVHRVEAKVSSCL